MGCAVAELRVNQGCTCISVMSSLSTLKHAGARLLWLSLLFIVVLWVAIGDNHDSSVSCYKCLGWTTNLLCLLGIGKPRLQEMQLVYNADTWRALCCAHSYSEDDDGSVHTLFCQSVFNFLSVLTCRHLSWQRLSPHREAICDTNATQALTLRATICHGPRQNHNAAPHCGLLIVSILCSNTSLFRCR